MRRSLSLGAVALVFFGFAAAAHGQAMKQAAGHASDEAAIRKLADEYAAGWNAASAQQAVAIMAPDAVFFRADGTPVKGKAAIEKDMAQDLAGPYKGTKFRATVDGFDFVKPDVAVAYGTTEISGGQMAAGQGKGHYMVVCTKTGGEWKVRGLHPGIVPPPPPPKMPPPPKR